VIIDFKSQFRCENMNDAVLEATKRWRDVTGKPDAELPWSATLSITDDYSDDREGKHVELHISTDIPTGDA
jgi:hypothetical protein